MSLIALHLAAKQADLKDHRGAPKKLQLRKIAQAVAQHYYALTGKKPTVPKKDGIAYGPFLDLLTEVYMILDFKKNASAEAQAEEISRNWEAVKAKFPIARHGIK